MASTFSLNSVSYQGRYLKLTCTQVQEIDKNRSKINWKLESIGGTSPNYSTGPTTVKIGGKQVYYLGRVNWSTKKFPAAIGSVSGSEYFNHNADGTLPAITCSIKTDIYTNTTPVEKTDTWQLDVIPRKATITSWPSSFNDEENPTIKYSNLAGSVIDSLEACISFTGSKDDVKYKTILEPSTSGSFQLDLTDEDKEALQIGTANAKSRQVYFFLKTVIGGVTYYDKRPATLNIVNADPVINPTLTQQTDFRQETGDNANETYVRFLSDVEVKISVTPQKSATLKSVSVTNNGKTYTGSSIIIRTLEDPEFTITATDSRGNTTTITESVTMVPYVKKTLNIGQNRPDGEGNFVFKVTGDCFNGNFGGDNKSNGIMVEYRYTEYGKDWSATGGSNGWVVMNVTQSGNKYTATASITGLDYQSQYVFQACITDDIGTVQSREVVIQTSPIFDWGASDFQFNVPVYVKDSPDPSAPAQRLRVAKCVNRNKSGSNPWFKVASLKLPAAQAYESRASFKVTYGYSSATAYGILDAHVKVNKKTENDVTSYPIGNVSFTFESGHNINRENFYLAYDNPTNPTCAEIWVNLPSWYCCHFEVLSESSTSTFLYNEWQLHSADSATGQAAEVPSTYTKVAAMLGSALLAYPVGSIYISYKETSPASLFGGSWTRINNRFLWGADQNAIDNNKLGTVGGSQNVTLTIDQIPAHTHDVGSVYSQHADGDKVHPWISSTGSSLAYGNVQSTSVGGGKAHTNMPPYIMVTIWRRTA